ncbi:hypothetical protein [Paraburkholderia aromaticivorans]|uniref:hypothetical protein n=1 Tax=Paraburkholderia aromaticivorans TaxID=2026199 RepID=UPI0014561090|nr:hypothetical protein [Paraburkholderia aromaticivorans]
MTEAERASSATTARLRKMLTERGVTLDVTPFHGESVRLFIASLVVPVTVPIHHGPSMADVHAAADRMISADHEYADRRAALDAMLTEMSRGLLTDVLTNE